MTRRGIIEKKRKELQRIINAWAAENSFLDSNERLEVTLNLKRCHSYMKRIVVRKNISENDWKAIKSLDWTERQKKVVNLFRGNKSLTARYIAKKIPDIGDEISVFTLFDAINRNFRDEHLPYHLKRFGLYGSRVLSPEKPYKIVSTRFKEE